MKIQAAPPRPTFTPIRCPTAPPPCRAGARVPSAFSVVIPIRFHVLHDIAGRGRLTVAAVQRQVDTMNRAYSGQMASSSAGLGGYSEDTGIRFSLDAVLYHQTAIFGARAKRFSPPPARTLPITSEQFSLRHVSADALRAAHQERLKK